MEEPRPSLFPIPAPRKCRRLIDTPDSDADDVTLQPLKFIAHNVFSDSIIWLDLFSNERDLTFARQMVNANRLTIFDTAVDCIDFVELSCLHHEATPVHSTFSIIVSGDYVTDAKVVKKLLQHDCVKQICLIVNEFRYENLCSLHVLDQKINIIYNDDLDAVMCRLCNDYLHFEAFTLYNNKACTRANNSDSKHDRSFSDRLRKVDAKYDGRAVPDIQSDHVSTNNDSSTARTATDKARKVQVNEVITEIRNRASSNRGVKSIDSTRISSQFDHTSSRYDWEPKSTERPLTPAPRNSNDVLILEKLEHIEQVHSSICLGG
jgi:hypothetical protein